MDIHPALFCAFLDKGGVPISNNLAENAFRPFTLGRKNWLFCNTPKGAEASAVVYFIVESVKANGVEPFAYLQRVLVERKRQTSPQLTSALAICDNTSVCQQIV